MQDTKVFAKNIRINALKMVHAAKSSHIGACFSMADILAVLYNNVLNIKPNAPDWPERDRLIISKGHAAAIAYATLAERGFFPQDWLKTFCADGTYLSGHITAHQVPGVELSTGSLGHGLSVGCGMALNAKRKTLPYRVYVILSDGELDEGSNWESILFAPQHQLDNLIVIVDYNKIQSLGSVKDVLELDPLADKFKSFRWSVQEIDGHNIAQLEKSFSACIPQEKPHVIIAHTIKGKGVSFMENKLMWHYKSPDDNQLKIALEELEKDL